MFGNKVIKRYISQKCIGYQSNGKPISEAVYECNVEFTDGTEGTIWQLEPTAEWVDGILQYVRPTPMDYQTHCPRIDKPVRNAN